MHRKAQSAAILATLSAVLVTASPIKRDFSRNPADILRRHLVKRNNVGVACGLWATSNWADTGKGLGEDADEVTIGPNSCGRIGCYDTSGVYVCNDQGVEITIPMQEAIDQVDYLKEICMDGSGEGYYYVSGQVFSDSYGGYNCKCIRDSGAFWSRTIMSGFRNSKSSESYVGFADQCCRILVNIGFCNTNDPNDAKPSQYIFPGPNGNPKVTCGGKWTTISDKHRSKTGTLTMTSRKLGRALRRRHLSSKLHRHGHARISQLQ